MALVGAIIWGAFSFGSGVATTVIILGAMRIGAGLGKAVNDPVHGSLLSDYYGPHTRTKVFAAHRGANTVGAFFGALLAGFLGELLGWRVPFIAFAFPTLALVVVALFVLREPERTGRRAFEGTPSFVQSFRILWRIGTMRRLWLAFPFLAFTAIGMGPLMSLYYDDVFTVSAGFRGVIAAFDSPFIILGLVIGAPLMDRGIVRDPGMVMRRVGIAAGGIGVLIAGVAASPVLPMAIAFQYGIIATSTLLFAGGTAVVSLVTPPEVRAFAFSFFNISSLLGVVALPLVGIVGDAVGIRWGLVVLTPFLLIGASIVASSGRFASADVAAVNAPSPDVSTPR